MMASIAPFSMQFFHSLTGFSAGVPHQILDKHLILYVNFNDNLGITVAIEEDE